MAALEVAQERPADEHDAPDRDGAEDDRLGEDVAPAKAAAAAATAPSATNAANRATVATSATAKISATAIQTSVKSSPPYRNNARTAIRRYAGRVMIAR